jgi:hypothetical protein
MYSWKVAFRFTQSYLWAGWQVFYVSLWTPAYTPEAGFLVSTESDNGFLFTWSGYLFRMGDLETVTTFHKTRRKQDPSPLFKTGRKRDKLEKPGRKRGKRPKIPRIAGEQMPGRKHEETGK